MIQTARYPSIEEVAAPMPAARGRAPQPQDQRSDTAAPASPGCRLCPLPGRTEAARAARQGANRVPVWAPDGKHFAALNTTDAGIELWVCEVAELKLEKVKGVKLNATVGDAAQWMPDNRSLLVQLIPEGRGEVPTPPIRAERSGRAGERREGRAAFARSRTC